MLAGVPSGAGQYRFVRVVRVLIFHRTRSCIGFVLAAKALVSHHCRSPPQARFPDLAAPGGLALVRLPRAVRGQASGVPVERRTTAVIAAYSDG